MYEKIDLIWDKIQNWEVHGKIGGRLCNICYEFGHTFSDMFVDI